MNEVAGGGGGGGGRGFGGKRLREFWLAIGSAGFDGSSSFAFDGERCLDIEGTGDCLRVSGRAEVMAGDAVRPSTTTS